MLNRINIIRKVINNPILKKISSIDNKTKVDSNKVTVKAVYTGDFTALDGIEYEYFRDGVQIHSTDIPNENPNPAHLLAEFRAMIAEIKGAESVKG